MGCSSGYSPASLGKGAVMHTTSNPHPFTSVPPDSKDDRKTARPLSRLRQHSSVRRGGIVLSHPTQAVCRLIRRVISGLIKREGARHHPRLHTAPPRPQGGPRTPFHATRITVTNPLQGLYHPRNTLPRNPKTPTFRQNCHTLTCRKTSRTSRLRRCCCIDSTSLCDGAPRWFGFLLSRDCMLPSRVSRVFPCTFIIRIRYTFSVFVFSFE